MSINVGVVEHMFKAVANGDITWTDYQLERLLVKLTVSIGKGNVKPYHRKESDGKVQEQGKVEFLGHISVVKLNDMNSAVPQRWALYGISCTLHTPHHFNGIPITQAHSPNTSSWPPHYTHIPWLYRGFHTSSASEVRSRLVIQRWWSLRVCGDQGGQPHCHVGQSDHLKG